MKIKNKYGLCGLWVSPQVGEVFATFSTEANKREQKNLGKFLPFAWISDHELIEKENPPYRLEALKGNGALNRMLSFDTLSNYSFFLKNHKAAETVGALENQFLLKKSLRFFENMQFNALKRCQCDIETASNTSGFSNAHYLKDRILAIGLQMDGKVEILELKEDSDEGESRLLQEFIDTLQAWDPDTIEGHNFYKFDLEYLRIRSKLHKMPLLWGRYGQIATVRNSRFKIAERFIDFPRFEIPGRTIVDTYLLIQQYDLAKRALKSYSLKSVAVALGITPNSNDRVYLSGKKMQEYFNQDRSLFLAYLKDDLRETKGLADLLLPTYFAQVKNFPLSFQDTILRGTGTKIDSIFLEKYFHSKYALPLPEPVMPFEGGFTKGFEAGVFENVLHYDFASLYPSLLLSLNQNPKNDLLGIFLPTLKELRDYRLKYKKLAKEENDPILKEEYQARQNSFKILINSFYGYLGFSGGHFCDGELAAKVTAYGRELLQKLISQLEKEGCLILEADTDGLYLSSEKYFKDPYKLIEKVLHLMPEEIDLEFDASFKSMFAYKAKNYALWDGKNVLIRGSALRSRATEPFLKELTEALIYYLLGCSSTHPRQIAQEFKQEIIQTTIPIEKLAKSERLSQNPLVYKKSVENAKKPRRAALEVALKKEPLPKMGDKITYFIKKSEKPRMADWIRATAVELYDKDQHPYDPAYYIKKCDDWLKRYQDFLK